MGTMRCEHKMLKEKVLVSNK